MQSIDSDIFTLHRRAQNCIAQNYLTNSKRPETFVKGVYPSHIKRGHGCWLWDHNDKKYLDFICGLGTNIIGYGHTQVNTAIAEQLNYGYSHSFGTHHEIELAEYMKGLFPFVDCWKFSKTGSEACNAAIKIARAATGRSLILSEGYHGHGDDFISLTEPALGVPKSPGFVRAIRALEVDTIHPGVAAVIVEPVITDWSNERRAWLQNLRDVCTKNEVLLIFDEVINGFRFPKFCVSNYWGITPDLLILGKAMANGMPLAAVGGKFSVMNKAEYFISSTYAGETLSLVAAKKTMELLQSKFDINTLWKQGQAFIDDFNTVCPELVRIEGYPTRGVFVGDATSKALFMQEACLAGMLFGPSWFFNYGLADEASNALSAIKAILGRIKRGEVKLKGELPKSPFAQKVRGQ